MAVSIVVLTCRGYGFVRFSTSWCPDYSLTGCIKIPKPIQKLLKVLHGPTVFKNQGAKIKRPYYLHALVPFRGVAPSDRLEDYIGGHIKINGKRWRFWLPLWCSIFAVAPNLPESVRKTIVEKSPLAVPLVCGPLSKPKNRPVLQIRGSGFQQFDPKIANQLNDQSQLIVAELANYSRWLHKKKQRRKACIKTAETFYPRIQNGRFVSTAVTPEIEFMSVALAVFLELLQYATKRNWIGRKDALRIFNEAWTQVLPESAPQTGSGSGATINAARSWNEPNVFWTFLDGYLQAHQQQISLAGAPCDRNTIAVAHQLKGEKYFILPRSQCTTAYADYLSQQGVALPEERKKWETDLQCAILDWGIQIKRENNSVSWRFNFYKKDDSKGECKVHCLAFPLTQLPDFIMDKLTDWFGNEFEQWMSPQFSRNEVDAENVVENNTNSSDE